MTQITETSLLALNRTQPKINHNQEILIEIMRRREPLTNREIADLAHWEINRVTPRINELVKMGVVVVGEKRVCRITGGTADTKRLRDELPPKEYVFTSSRNPNLKYRLRDWGYRQHCECPGYQYTTEKHCKHIDQLKVLKKAALF